MKKIILAASIFSLCLSVMSFQFGDTTNDKDAVQYGTKLNWDDFKAKPDTNKKTLQAFSYIIYSYNHQITGDSVRVVVRNSFYRKYSWVKPNSKNTQQLNFQQGYFDISEINARRMRKNIATVPIYSQTANKQIGAMYSQAIKDRAKEQGQYQTETEYGKNKTKQAEWDKKNKDLLNSINLINPTAINPVPIPTPAAKRIGVKNLELAKKSWK